MNLSRWLITVPTLLWLMAPAGASQANSVHFEHIASETASKSTPLLRNRFLSGASNERAISPLHTTLAIQNSVENNSVTAEVGTADSGTAEFDTVKVNSSLQQTDVKQANEQLPPAESQTAPDTLCPEPALSRVIRHRVASGETLTSLSQRYNLIPATLMGMNPVLRGGNAPVGAEILVPPYNGIRIEVPAGSTWQDLAEAYGTRADVLFEVNGCQASPSVVFVPGVNWSPNQGAAGTSTPVAGVLSKYPLSAIAFISMGYGWQVGANSGEVAFHSGVDLTADQGTPVLAAGEGTVAFAANQGNYGNLVVINHSQGLQTRYAQLDSIAVEVGQTVRPGDRIGTVGATGIASSPHLHFEVRTNSDLGWVAQDPGVYFQDMRLAEQ